MCKHKRRAVEYGWFSILKVLLQTIGNALLFGAYLYVVIKYVIN